MLYIEDDYQEVDDWGFDPNDYEYDDPEEYSEPTLADIMMSPSDFM